MDSLHPAAPSHPPLCVCSTRVCRSLHPTADDLMVAVTGSPLDPQIFLTYIKDKYSALYKL